jgi:HlyD family secretion protein
MALESRNARSYTPIGVPGRTEVKAVIGTPGFRPHLRDGLRFYRDATLPDVVVVHDPVHNSKLQLYEVECLIAKQMDGSRDLEAITRAAKPHVPWATREHVEKLAVQIAGMGLLANVPIARRAPTPPPIPSSEPRPVEPSSMDGLDSPTALGLADAFLEPEPQQELSESAAEPVATTLPPPDGDDGLGQALADVQLDLPAPPPSPEPVPQAAATPDAGDAWIVEKVPWYKRRSVRRLGYLSIPVLIIAVLGLIPYPLYVTEPATVYPLERAYVRAPVHGIVAEVHVGEGDLVEAGAPLVRLDDREYSFELRKAEAELQRLRSNLEKNTKGSRPEEIKRAEAQVKTRASDVQFAAKNLTRMQKLLNDGVVSPAQRDEAARDLAVKQSVLAEAQAELKLVKAGVRSEEVAVAAAEVRRAQAHVEHYEKQLTRLLIRSPISGRVLTPRFRERLHEKVGEGDLVVEIGNTSSMRVEIEVPEREADVVAVGQTVTLKVHSFPLKAFHGKVTFVAPAVETKSDARILRVDALFENVDGVLQPGMSGYAEIDAGERTVLSRITRRAIRWIRVRFLL